MENIKELLQLSLIERERTTGKPVTDQERKEIEDAVNILLRYGGEVAVLSAIIELRTNN